MYDFKWEVGTYFIEKKDFTDAMHTYSFQNGKNLNFVKNDKKRVSMKCVGVGGKCTWYAYCAYMFAINTWQLRTIIDIHTYSKDFNLKLMNSKWLSKHMEKTVRENPHMNVIDMREKVSRKWNIGTSRNMADRAKVMTAQNVESSCKEQFKRIYDYAHELLRTNPGSTVKIKVEEVHGELIFRRFYTCLKACKDSFTSCRPFIGLDGCFLKSKYGGELLKAIGRDDNEQILPIAYAVCKTREN